MSESGCPGFKDEQDEDWEQLKNTNSFELILLMRSGQLASTLSVTIYKAPQKGKGQKLLQEGFQVVDFPYNPPYLDGSCYFAGQNDRSIAEEFNESYQEGILEVYIDQASYEQYFKSLECRYDEKDGCERIEVVVPQSLFPILNQFPRVLKSR
ncbi:hypothetical protein [Dolichospermum sp. LEGE 00240]|uniref:hypothetical protein n=1 Tax=Dolichospermum sp. LEGE 00240 TaxID=1828603 RepID=UPI001D14182F|nr:hypothetical protein [Dolichospermum sp. LEGE 00240]